MKRIARQLLVSMSLLSAFLICSFNALATDTTHIKNRTNSPVILAGERLFMETRFAQRFKAFIDHGGEVNQTINSGDPALEKTSRYFSLPPYQIPFADGPYAGKTFNCRACHMLDEHVNKEALGMRAYADFASRSPLPTRDDGQYLTVRNVPSLVDAALPRHNMLLHMDGEFDSTPELIGSTLSGRNMGWLPGEKAMAYQHICRVIREDNGTDELASRYDAISYSKLLVGKNSTGKPLEPRYLLPNELRLYVSKVKCDDIVKAVSRLLSAYVKDLQYTKDDSTLSPYDVFLKINELPAAAAEGETDIDYSKRLLGLIQDRQKKGRLKFVHANPGTPNGAFRFHDQPFVFEQRQLEGLIIFFTQDKSKTSGTGNCIACHAAPHFTDFGLHNVGVTQVEYDTIHGQDEFSQLKIPDIANRDQNGDMFLPATDKHPKRQGIFRKAASESDLSAVDLGAWSIFLNNDYPYVQEKLYALLCPANKNPCQTNDDALKRSIAAFKTPGLRNLGHSAPYMHNGLISDLYAVVGYYSSISNDSRQGLVRNTDPELDSINLTVGDINPVVQFLISLYEDYQ